MTRLPLRRLVVALLATVATSVVALTPAAPASAAPVKQDVKISFAVQPGSTPASTSEASPYLATDFQVAAVNGSRQNFDEVWLAYNRVSNPLPMIVKRAPFPIGQVQMFTVGNCSDINVYALGLVRAGSIVYNTGNIKPSSCSEIVKFA